MRHETIAQRHCRFPDEKLENSVLPYSFSSCFTDKRIAMELKLCNCTLFTSPVECKKLRYILHYQQDSYMFVDKDSYCDYNGLLCIGDGRV